MFLDRGYHGDDMRHRVQYGRTDTELHVLPNQHWNNDIRRGEACLSGGDLLQLESCQEVGSSGSAGGAGRSPEKETGYTRYIHIHLFSDVNKRIP